MKDFRDLKVWEKAHELVLDCYTQHQSSRNMRSLALSRRSGGRVLRSRPTSLSDAVAAAMPNSNVFCKWQWVQRANWNITFFFPLICTSSHGPHDRLRDQIVEIKKMLANLIRKVDQDRR